MHFFQNYFPLDFNVSASYLPAFPGAEGFGTATSGGRGGQVIKVTNLNASGPGSLKAALEATGPRIVVFTVSGTINMGCNAINLFTEDQSYLTVAGQTAPGDGILLKGKIVIKDAHDVVIRYLRIRPEDPGVGPADSCDPIRIHDSAYNIVIDHNSLSWGTDENLDIAIEDPEGVGKEIRNITASWNIIAEGDADSAHSESDPSIGEHSMGTIIDKGASPDMVEDISIHHNLYMHSNKRNPLIQQGVTASTPTTAGVVRLVNNVFYNWGKASTTLSATAGQVNRVDLIGNYYRKGPSSTTSIPIWCYGSTASANGTCQLYLAGNTYQEGIGGGVTLADVTLTNQSGATLVVDKKSNPLKDDGVAVDNSVTALSRVTAEAGATLPKRDSIDLRLINELLTGTGKVGIDNDHIRKYPTLASTTAPTDTDNDGMPDSWETQYGFNKNSATDGNLDADQDGYHNIEEYLNGTSPLPTGPTVTPTSTICAYDVLNLIPGKVEAENFTCGAEGVAFHDTTVANQGLSYRPLSSVDIQSTNDTGGGYNVGWTITGEWLKYVATSAGGTYNVAVRAATGLTNGAVRLKVDGNDVSGLVIVPNTGGFQIWADVPLPQVTLTPGTHTFQLVFEGPVNLNYIYFALASGTTPSPMPSPTMTPIPQPSSTPPPTSPTPTTTGPAPRNSPKPTSPPR